MAHLEYDYVVKGGSVENPTWEWICNADRHYTQTLTTFTKRQLKTKELIYRADGSVAETKFQRQRLENEQHALAFIASNTTIPVPRIVEWTDIDGVGSLTTEAIKGDTYAYLYYSLESEKEKQQKLADNVMRFVKDIIRPQLRKLCSKRMGQLSGDVVPPVPVSHINKRPCWEPRTSSTDRYVYCHNDLADHNIMCDPETLEVLAVIDWEYSGFFPPEFEWNFFEYGREASLEEEHGRELIALLEAPGDPSIASRLLAVVKPLSDTFFRFFFWIQIRGSRILSMLFVTLGFP